ncbi:MAG: FAD-dependent oxidoreductase [Solirubrobacterales bacterium]
MSAVASASSIDLSVLWQELQIGDVTLKNRVALNPVNTLWSNQGLLSDRHLDYYEERARGGLGLIISEQHIADRERLSAFRNSSSALVPEAKDRLRAAGERVHPHGTAQFVQFVATGPLDNANIAVGGFEPIWAPTVMPSNAFAESAMEMGPREIRELIDNFTRAAKNVAEAGLDGVEIHGSHSWLIHRFLSPLYNHRTDEYGGSVEGRTRLLREIAEEIRSKVPELKALGVQLSVEDYRGAAGITAEYVEEELAFIGTGLFDFINLSTGNELTDEETIPPMERPGIPAEHAGARARAAVGPGVKVCVGGGIRTVEEAARLVGSGIADFVALARPLLADPALVRKAQEGRTDQIRPCIGTNECFRTAIERRGVSCLMNPFVGREGRWSATATVSRPNLRKIVVVGGGPAGLQAATAAAEHGHDVTLFEREPSTGGHLRLYPRLPHRGRWQDAIDWFDGAARRAGVDVRTGIEATAGMAELGQADAVLFATGSTWQDTGFVPILTERPRIPGVEQENVLTIDAALERALDDPGSLGGSLVIFDETGGYLPLGLADAVSEAGARVAIVTRFESVAHKVRMACDHLEVFARLAGRDVRLLPGHVIDAIDGDRVLARELWSARELPLEGVTTVALSLYRTADTSLFDEVRDPAADSQLVGDAKTPRETAEVIAEGQAVGFEL